MAYIEQSSDHSAWARRARRVLINGPPNSRKTSSLATWPGELIIQSYPGEKGTSSIPTTTVDGKLVKAFVFDQPEVAAEMNWATVVKETKQLAIDIVGGKHGPVVTYAGDGLHKLYCPMPEQRVLTKDLRWVAAGSLRPGDSLLAFEAARPGPRRSRRFLSSVVTHHGFRREPVYRIILSDGSELYSTGEHPWLHIRMSGDAAYVQEWKEARKLRVGLVLPKFFSPWPTTSTEELGWLSGLFDGEGSVGRYKDARGKDGQLHLGLAQKPGPVLDRAMEILAKLSVPFGVYANPNGCSHLQVWGKANQARLLGQLRPVRLLPKLDVSWFGTLRAAERVTIEAVEPWGEREIVELSTSSETYICEGFGSHNSSFLHEATFGASAKGQDFDAKLYGAASQRFFGFIDLLMRSPVPNIVFTCWDGHEKDDPDERGTAPSRHIFPELPGQAAKKVMGEFSVVVYANRDVTGKYCWQTQPAGKVWGAGVKMPLEIAKTLPITLEQDWRLLEKALKLV